MIQPLLLDGQSFGIANVGQVGDELEVVDQLGAFFEAALHTKAEHSTKSSLEILLCDCIGRMALKTRVGNPADFRALLKILCQSEGVLGMALCAQGESLDTNQQLLRRKGIKIGTQVAHNLNSRADDKGDGTESLPELQTVITLRRLDELGEAGCVGTPVELAAIDNDTSDSCTVSANPFCRRVHDNVGAVVDGSQKVPTGTESVVNLKSRV